MSTQEEITRWANMSQMDDDFLPPLLSESQNTSMPIQESCPEVEIVTLNPTKRGGNFSVDEDNILVSTWLNTSVDAVQGTDQRIAKFWKKIWQYFCENNTCGTTRFASSLQSRWGNINKETSRFAGFMAKIEALNPSGGTYEDKLGLQAFAGVVVSMGRSTLRKLLLDDSDEDEIMRRVLKGSTSQRKRRRQHFLWAFTKLLVLAVED
nr:glutathione s-transferase t3 [Quercus suber]